jgi:cytochrome oxidase assembly protein ShyY1
MNQPRKAKSIVFHVIILGTIIGTCALGVWQLQRREWKHDVLARLEQSYGHPPEILKSIAENDLNNLSYTHKIIAGNCNAENISLQPGRYYQGRAGYHVFCTVKNPAGENLLVMLGWTKLPFSLEGEGGRRPDEGDMRIRNSYSSIPLTRLLRSHPLPQGRGKNFYIHLKNPALLLPFAPQPWWLPKSTNPNEMMWPAMSPAPHAYPVYAVLDAQNGEPLPGTEIIPTGQRPELPDGHLQYAITWFALAGVLLALYIYRQWQNQP